MKSEEEEEEWEEEIACIRVQSCVCVGYVLCERLFDTDVRVQYCVCVYVVCVCVGVGWYVLCERLFEVADVLCELTDVFSMCRLLYNACVRVHVCAFVRVCMYACMHGVRVCDMCSCM